MDSTVTGLIAGIVGLLVGCAVGASALNNVWQSRAIDHGAAVWTIDPKTGETEFKWLKCEREPTTAKGE